MITFFNLNFQNPNSINHFNLINFHNNLIILIIIIILFIIIILKFNIINKFTNKIIIENQIIEIIWTILPIIIIIYLLFNSIKLLFINNEIKLNSLFIKTFGNQWFWNYEYPNLNLSFNSYIIYKNNFNFFSIETDNNLIIPSNFQILIIITSIDVIHSWTIPSINIKIDAIPNQINRFNIITFKPSIIYGQCSEICGINHRFIPIKIESILINNFIKWI